MEWITTSTIIHDLRDLSNQTAWRSFVDRFHRPIVRFVGAMGLSKEDAEDIAQETLVVFADSLRSGRYDRERGKLRTWLFGIAYKKGLGQRQNARRRERFIDPSEEAERVAASVPDEKSAERMWNTYWERFLVRECIEQIRKEFRPTNVRAFELIVKEGYTAQEAATEVGVTRRAVYNAKHRILTRMRQLKAELEEMG